jgi:hypothetical protein
MYNLYNLKIALLTFRVPKTLSKNRMLKLSCNTLPILRNGVSTRVRESDKEREGGREGGWERERERENDNEKTPRGASIMR